MFRPQYYKKSVPIFVSVTLMAFLRLSLLYKIISLRFFSPQARYFHMVVSQELDDICKDMVHSPS